VRDQSDERVVWVAKQRESRLTPSKNTDAMVGPSGAGQLAFRSATMHELFSKIESAHKVLVDDETGLSGRYDLSWGIKDNFDAIRERLDREYGILLTKTKRPTRIIHVKPTNNR